MQRKRIVTLSMFTCVALAAGAWFYGCGRPPQMGADDEVFRTVDALYTAVTARQDKLLGPCESRLHAQRTAGKLPPAAAAYLDNVIATARRGRWQAAAENLYDFMAAQRRVSP